MATIPAGTVASHARKVLLICDRLSEPTRLTQGAQEIGQEWQVYSRLIEAALERVDLDAVLYLRPGRADMPDVILKWASGLADRVRVVTDLPLSALLAQTDILVSFASSALIEGGREGLKPVQIGRVLAGSAGFSHVFPDIASFAAALRSDRIAGSMSLVEHARFEEFHRQFAEANRELERDPVVLACRPPGGGRTLSGQRVVSALANPFAAFRLIQASLYALRAKSAPRSASRSGKRSVTSLFAGGSNERAS